MMMGVMEEVPRGTNGYGSRPQSSQGVRFDEEPSFGMIRMPIGSNERGAGASRPSSGKLGGASRPNSGKKSKTKVKRRPRSADLGWGGDRPEDSSISHRRDLRAVDGLGSDGQRPNSAGLYSKRSAVTRLRTATAQQSQTLDSQPFHEQPPSAQVLVIDDAGELSSNNPLTPMNPHHLGHPDQRSDGLLGSEGWGAGRPGGGGYRVEEVRDQKRVGGAKGFRPSSAKPKVSRPMSAQAIHDSDMQADPSIWLTPADVRMISYRQWKELETERSTNQQRRWPMENSGTQTNISLGSQPSFFPKDWRQEVPGFFAGQFEGFSQLSDAKDPLKNPFSARAQGVVGERPILQDGLAGNPGGNPTMPQRRYVAGVFNKMVDSGKIPKGLNKVARRLYQHGQQVRLPGGGDNKEMLKLMDRGSSTFRPWSSLAPSIPKSRSRPGSSLSMSNTKAFPPSMQASLEEGKTVITIDEKDPVSPVKFLGFRGEEEDKNEFTEWEIAKSVSAVLQNCPLLKKLNEEAIHLLARGCKMVRYRSGTNICVKGQRSDCAYVIAEGQLLVSSPEDEDGLEGPEELNRLSFIGDIVGEISLLVGVRQPTTVTCVTGCKLVRIPVGALQSLIHAWPAVTNFLAEAVAHQRRLEQLESSAHNPASLLIKVLGINDIPKQRADVQPSIEVSVKSQEHPTQSKVKTIPGVTTAFNELPINQIFDLEVPERGSTIKLRLVHMLNKNPESAHEIGKAEIDFQKALQVRTMSMDLPLDKGGSMTVVVSVRGFYSMEELEIIEWLGEHHADLPMLLKCGITSVAQLQDMSHSELLVALSDGRVGDECKQRLAGLAHQAKHGPGFLGQDAKSLSSQIYRYYKVPGKKHVESRPTLQTKWENQLLATYLEDTIPHASSITSSESIQI